MRKKLLVIAGAVLVLALALGMGTYAWFTSNARSTNNTFTTGTLNISLNSAEAARSSQHLIEVSNQEPGGAAVNLNPYNVENGGSLGLKFRIRLENLTFQRGAAEISPGTLRNGGNDIKLDLKLGNLEEQPGELGIVDLKEWLENSANNYTLEPGSKFPITGTIRLADTADNTYQNVTVKCDIAVYAAQKGEGASY